MIRINKAPNVPALLNTNGQIERNAVCTLYLSNPGVYKVKYHKTANPHKLDFKSSIYGAEAVKNQLVSDQHQKCCFCEGMFLENAYGDVEHFRPKGGFHQKSNDPIGKPGYYWLAYRWDNLMFSCQICNQTHKKNLFPLVAGAVRALMHTDPLESVNDCLLINPNIENPETHIIFRQYVSVGLTPKGTNSITAYGLNRTKLNEARMRHLAEIKANIILSKIAISALPVLALNEIKSELGITTDLELQSVIDSAILFKNNCAKEFSKFSNMVRNNFPTLPKN